MISYEIGLQEPVYYRRIHSLLTCGSPCRDLDERNDPPSRRKRWQMLHRLVYFSTVASAIHYYWLVKSDETVPLRFAAIIGTLLAYRLLVGFAGRLHAARLTNRVMRSSVR